VQFFPAGGRMFGMNSVLESGLPTEAEKKTNKEQNLNVQR
jgi:hypothetical protein